MKILVIDDDDVVSQAIGAILASRKYETVLAPRATVGIFAFSFNRFDLVIVDIFMPGMGGLDTIARIRRASAVPIIAASGFKLQHMPSTDFFSSALRCGATVCLRKPFTPPQLLAAIDKCLSTVSCA